MENEGEGKNQMLDRPLVVVVAFGLNFSRQWQIVGDIFSQIF